MCVCRWGERSNHYYHNVIIIIIIIIIFFTTNFYQYERMVGRIYFHFVILHQTILSARVQFATSQRLVWTQLDAGLVEFLTRSNRAGNLIQWRIYQSSGLIYLIMCYSGAFQGDWHTNCNEVSLIAINILVPGKFELNVIYVISKII